MKSKFTFWAYVTTAIAMVITVIASMVCSGNALNPNMELGPILFFCSLFLFMWFWIVFGEMRTKVISVVIDNNQITVKRYLGLTQSKTYDLDGLDGFKTSILSSRSGSYEYLYVMRQGRKIAKLSEFYHSNYKYLKQELAVHKCKNRGYEPFSYWQELKEIFI